MAMPPFSTLNYVINSRQIIPTDQRVSLLSVIIFPSSSPGLSSVNLRNGNSGGSVLFHMEASQGGAACVWTTGATGVGAEFDGGLYAELINGASVQLEYVTEVKWKR